MRNLFACVIILLAIQYNSYAQYKINAHTEDINCRSSCSGWIIVSVENVNNDTLYYVWFDSIYTLKSNTFFLDTLCAGDYTFRMYNSKDFDTTLYFTLTEPEDSFSIDLDISYEPDQPNAAKVTATVVGSEGANYYWVTDKDTMVSTKNYYYVTKNYKNEICVYVTDINNCEKKKCLYLNTTSIRNNISNTELFKIYPNPFKDELYIETSKGNSEIQVVSLDGRVQYNGLLHQKERKINLNFIEKGVYTLVLENNGNKYCRKIVKF